MAQQPQKQSINSQRGVSAIFIVIFASLLLSLIAMSFISLMISDVGRSTDDEQSQGAYDAALAGVEDGKRVLSECLQNPASTACAEIDAGQCDTVQAAGINGASGDTEADVSSGGNDLNMAYTCVIVSREAPDYRGSVSSGTSGGGDAQVVIPLRPASGNLDHILIRWFSKDDVDGASLTLPAWSTDLPQKSTWPVSQPPVLRAHLIQYETNNMSAANFDESPYAHTLYLKPSNGAALSPLLVFSSDDRRNPSSNILQQVDCSSSIGVSGYACEAELDLPSLGAGVSRTAYLHLSSFYNNADVQVIMYDSANNSLSFDDVQFIIDSTGRANDLFRRVETRVEVGREFPYPRATVDITNNFCKTFSTADNPSDFVLGGCDPTQSGT